MNHTIHDETYEIRLVTSLGNSFSLTVSLSFELFKILGVKVIVSILQESMHSDCILVQELRKLGL